MDMYVKKCCPFCKALNLVWLGDWSRDTGVKPESAQCCKCEKCFLVSDPHQHEEDLYEIICSHFDCDDYNFTERELAKRLLDGETLDLEYGKMDLSEFLKVYSDTQKGEYYERTK